jgi:hypothetical protein
MIVIKVELHSAVTGRITQLGKMIIANDGKSYDPNIGSYDGVVLRKPDFKIVTRMGRIESHKKHAETIWHLIGKMLSNMGYK